MDKKNPTKPKNTYEAVFNGILIIGLIALFIAFLFLIPKQSEVLEEDLYYCILDSDCALVRGGCCGCNEGGNNTAVNNGYVGYWNAKMDKACKDVFCPQVISTHWTCSAQPVCFQNKCSLMQPA
jgi:hypothetical protein